MKESNRQHAKINPRPMIRSRVKSLILLSFLLFLLSILEAQNNISVKSFRLLETDLTANLEGTK